MARQGGAIRADWTRGNPHVCHRTVHYRRCHAEQLFDLVDDESRFLELRPGAVSHRDIERLESGGHACTQEFVVNGRRITQTCRAVRFERPSCVVDDVIGPGVQATVSSTFEDLGGGSRLTIRQEVALTRRANVLRRRTMRRVADRQLAAALTCIKAVAEDEPWPAPESEGLDDPSSSLGGPPQGDSEASGQLPDQIASLFSRLEPHGQQILRSRFGLDGGEPRTLDDVAILFGITREDVRQIELETMDRLRPPHDDDDASPDRPDDA